jgi:hypothetical protein
MRVTCNLCKFEAAGACEKKRRGGHPQKVQLTKRRTCNMYDEDPMKVFTSFRKKEANRAKMRQVELRRAKIAASIADLQRKATTPSAK